MSKSTSCGDFFQQVAEALFDESPIFSCYDSDRSDEIKRDRVTGIFIVQSPSIQLELLQEYDTAVRMLDLHKVVLQSDITVAEYLLKECWYSLNHTELEEYLECYDCKTWRALYRSLQASKK